MCSLERIKLKVPPCKECSTIPDGEIGKVCGAKHCPSSSIPALPGGSAS